MSKQMRNKKILLIASLLILSITTLFAQNSAIDETSFLTGSWEMVNHPDLGDVTIEIGEFYTCPIDGPYCSK